MQQYEDFQPQLTGHTFPPTPHSQTTILLANGQLLLTPSNISLDPQNLCYIVFTIALSSTPLSLFLAHTTMRTMRRPCCDKRDKNKGAWSKEEDEKLIDYIRAHGEGSWRSLPKAAGLLRCGKSCRLRWINYLQPNIKRGNFSEDEEDLIIKLHALLGNRWSLIAGRLPGRTDNEVKNYWNSHLRRKLINMGIDPNNHHVSQRLPLHRPQSSGSETFLDGPANQERREWQHLISMTDDDRVSDTASCLPSKKDAASCLEDNAYVLPDLNLDPTMSVPSPSTALTESKQESAELEAPSDLGNAANHTLLLFR